MAVRPIDANAMLNELRPVSFEAEHSAVLLSDVAKMMREWVNRQPTLTPQNEWVSVEERLPEPGERVLAANGSFVGEAYMASNGAWMRHDGFPWEVDAWMPMPDRRPPEGEA